MRPPRSSIAAMMAAIAVVALDIAVALAVFASNTELVIGGTLPCVALQCVVFRLLRRPGRVRAFLLGFAVCGSLITGSFLWAMLWPEVHGITRTGALVRMPDSPLYAMWMIYARLAGDWLCALLIDFSADPDPLGVGLIAFRAFLWSIPQIVIALVGGVIAWRIFGVRADSPSGLVERVGRMPPKVTAAPSLPGTPASG